MTRGEAAPQLVRDVMVRHPKTLSADASAGDARRFFANPKVITALLVDGGVFAGVLERDDLPASAPGRAPVREYASREVATISPDRPMRDALAVLDAHSTNRLVVLASDGVTLAGLLCLDLQRAGFCQG
ncbi:MAG: CBS domain-containing protein [Streptosporangiaceae bacterium]